MLECVIVCDRYGDFLAETLPHTLRAVDRLVVTGVEDRETQALCARYDATCVPTWVHRRAGGFDKARAINAGLAHLAGDGWLLHLDADIVLPDRVRDWLADHPLDAGCIYGVDRYDCRGWADWRRIKASGWLESRREWGYLIHPPQGLAACSRVGHRDYGGWLPIGYFQLWHGSRGRGYPVKPGAGGDHTDVLHAAAWPPEQRRLIGDFKVVHLSTGGAAGANWAGRTTPRFGPPPDDAVPTAGYATATGG